MDYGPVVFPSHIEEVFHVKIARVVYLSQIGYPVIKKYFPHRFAQGQGNTTVTFRCACVFPQQSGIRASGSRDLVCCLCERWKI